MASVRQIKICSFNICKLSRNNISTNKKIEKIAKIINQGGYSIVALQEVIDEHSVQELSKILDGNWAYSYARPPKMTYSIDEWKKIDNEAAEGYAFLWNTYEVDLASTEVFNKDGHSFAPPLKRIYYPRIVNMDSHEIICDRTLRLIRNPYYGRFVVRNYIGSDSGLFEIRIINAHIIFGVNNETSKMVKESIGESKISDIELRRKEFDALSKSIFPGVDNRVYGRNPLKESDVNTGLIHYTFLMGDYNLNLCEQGSPALTPSEECIILCGAKQRNIITVQGKKTTVKDVVSATDNNILQDYYSNNYDHFTYDELQLSDLSIGIEVIDVIKKYYSKEQDPCQTYKDEISDHIPIGLSITYGHDRTVGDKQWKNKMN